LRVDAALAELAVDLGKGRDEPVTVATHVGVQQPRSGAAGTASIRQAVPPRLGHCRAPTVTSST
jgi:hypothetical protein